MKISVIVPVYNGQDVLEKCLDSILKQTYQNIEIIVVNDGSTDHTFDIIERYVSQYANIIAVHKSNEGLPQARKTGVKHATGEYVGFVDADDWIEPDMYEKLYQACKKNKAEIACAGIYMDYPSGKSKILGRKKDTIVEAKEALEALNKRQYIFTYAWNKLYEIQCLKKIVYPTGNFVGEDYFIVTQILEDINKAVWIECPLYHYIQTDDSMCRGGYNANYRIAMKNYRQRCQAQKRKFPELSKCIDHYFITEVLSFVIAMGKNKNYDKEMLKKIRQIVKQNFLPYVMDHNVDISYRLSAVAFMVHYKLLIQIYFLFKKKRSLIK